MPPRKYSEQEKRRIIDDLRSGLSVVELSQRYDVPRSTLYSWRNKDLIVGDKLPRRVTELEAENARLKKVIHEHESRRPYGVCSLTQAPSEIIEYLDTEEWFRDDTKAQLRSTLQQALQTITNRQSSRLAKEQEVSRFLHEVWRNYTNNVLAEVVTEFANIERSMPSFVPRSENRYKDHFIHMFNTYIFGALVLSAIVKREDCEEVLKDIFKVVKENPTDFPFTLPQKPYTARRRLLFIWTLMAAVHDLAVPLKHLGSILTTLDQYFVHFGLTMRQAKPDYNYSTGSAINYYIDLMARLFAAGIELDTDNQGNCTGHYRLALDPEPVFALEMRKALENQDHGILGAVCLFRSVEDSFLARKAPRIRSPIGYVKTVLEQDVARSALGVALHSVKNSGVSRLFPISFKKFPLAFLLILCDELQEFFRTEYFAEPYGFREAQVIREWPMPTVELEGESQRLLIKVAFRYEDLSPLESEAVLKDFNSYMKRQDASSNMEENYHQMFQHRWNYITTTLQKKIAIREAKNDTDKGDIFRLYLEFVYKTTCISAVFVE